MLAVTGASGFIGSQLALRLAAAGQPFRALGRRANAVEAERLDAIASAGGDPLEVDLADAEALRAAFAGCDAVVHLAAAQHEANVADEWFERVNVDGTRQALAAAEAAGVRRFVHGSTIGVYGPSEDGVVRDGSPLGPDNVYGRTKLAAEAVVREFPGRLERVIARISETWGPGDQRLLKLFRGAARGWMLQVGPARNLHHLIHVDDLLEGLEAATRSEKAAGRTFVLAGPRAIETRELLRGIADAFEARVRILRVPLAPLLGVAWGLERTLGPLGIQPPLHRRRMDFFRKSFCFAMDEAREAIGWAPRIGFADAVGPLVEWYRERGLL